MQLPKETLSNFIENSYGRIKNQFLSMFNSGQRRFIFNGPCGVGKTFLAKAFANDNGLDFKEINLYTLEYGEEEDISKVIYSYIIQEAVSTSLFSQRKKLLYITDIEKLMKVDPSILKRLKNAGDALIVFESHGGDIFRADKRQFISGYAVISFYKINIRTLSEYLHKIASMNGLDLSNKKIMEIASNSDGNVMSAITDLHIYSIIGETELVHRNPDSNIFSRLNSVLSGDVSKIDTYFPSQQDAKNFEIWMAEKLPLAFKGEKLYLSFEYLSSADIILNKIKAQNWMLLKYIRYLLFDAISSLSDNASYRIDYTGPKWNLYY
ncbi:MAG: AAA family ATPase [Candidatus Parvarchaeota archaeon]|nr:AAA family ATPase [Candidatus Parvarchaeota archaeon]MCW1301702.1 AAA family ATPase [Candidatus Parvarchaeota archaeon]